MTEIETGSSRYERGNWEQWNALMQHYIRFSSAGIAMHVKNPDKTDERQRERYLSYGLIPENEK
ncbi:MULTISPECIES: hypothetical protein [Halorhodospira]|uniref:hypothetical protein n=1 Tax=Halorhodospira TaxID=85108 RepID=UPI001EE8B420|nr:MULTISPECIES: hypothetical protein [Halorhodospira]MCG5529238.1 hypothetical protein [Halorhodospira halophila]MCG5543087.1 hypothetical protein [Halorhodospira sp. 9628]MCG5543094.1 hypothetical protein [Halorhodospira sp. 9628]